MTGRCWAEGAGAPWAASGVIWGCFREPLACRLSYVRPDYVSKMEQTVGWGFTHARVHRQWVLEGFSAFQCTSISPAPKNSLPFADLLLSSTLTHSSGSDGDSDVDSELEERVDGVKSWLSKNKGSSKALSDDGSLKGSRWVQSWAWGWQAEDRLSCAGTWIELGGCLWMWHLVLCSHVVLVWMDREGLMLVSGSVFIGDTRPPTQGELPGPLPSSHHGGLWGIHSPKPICLPRACSAGL